MTIKDIDQVVADMYHVNDPHITKLIVAATEAARLPLSPIWLMLVGPSGSGKTEFLKMIDTVTGIVPISNLTVSTFASGLKTKGKSASLLEQLPSKKGGILLFKDFTSILSLHPQARETIIGQLREIYDGKYDKMFGNGTEVHWRGELGLIAASTDSIFPEREKFAAMGERFIMYTPDVPDTAENRVNLALRAMDNTTGMPARRKELSDMVKQYIDSELKVVTEAAKQGALPVPSADIRREIAKLGEFATRARSPIQRDTYSKDKHITFKSRPEMPTRMAEQLTALASAFMVINYHDTDDEALTRADQQILYKIAMDCIPPNRRMVLELLTEYNHAAPHALAQQTGFSTPTIKHWLEELAVLHVVNTQKNDRGQETFWLRTEYRAMMSKYQNIQQTDEDMPEPEGTDPDLPTFNESFQLRNTSLT